MKTNYESQSLAAKKTKWANGITTKTDVHVVVADLDRSKDYPLNFVCASQNHNIAWKEFKPLWQNFWNPQLGSARKLLQGASRKEKDDEIRKELKKRIKLLKSILLNKVITTDLETFIPTTPYFYFFPFCKSFVNRRCSLNLNLLL